MAANFSVDAARAEYFPRITLTGFVGGDSNALSRLFSGSGTFGGLGRNWRSRSLLQGG